jgi:hypothetical protein
LKKEEEEEEDGGAAAGKERSKLSIWGPYLHMSVGIVFMGTLIYNMVRALPKEDWGHEAPALPPFPLCSFIRLFPNSPRTLNSFSTLC